MINKNRAIRRELNPKRKRKKIERKRKVRNGMELNGKEVKKRKKCGYQMVFVHRTITKICACVCMCVRKEVVQKNQQPVYRKNMNTCEM